MDDSERRSSRLWRSCNVLRVLVIAMAVAPAYAQRVVDPGQLRRDIRVPRSRRPTPTRAPARSTSTTTAPRSPEPRPPTFRAVQRHPEIGSAPAHGVAAAHSRMHAPPGGGERRHALHAVRAVDLRSAKPAPLVVDLHGLNITPLQQILFDGTTDFAEPYGYIVVAPMGFSLSGWWGPDRRRSPRQR